MKILIINTVKVNIVHLYYPNAEIKTGNKISEKQIIMLRCLPTLREILVLMQNKPLGEGKAQIPQFVIIREDFQTW